MIAARYSMDRTAAAQLRQRQLRALQRATVYLWQHLQQVLNVPNTGQRRKRKYGRGSYTVYPNPSKPGEAPRKRTGFLQRNVKYDIDRKNISARVGVTENARYGAYLELLMDRPWLLVTARRLMPQMVRMMIAEVSNGP